MARTPQSQPAGSQLGRAIANHLADVIVNVRSRMAPIEQSHRIAVNNAWMEDAEQRLRPLMAAMVDGIEVDENTPDWLRHIVGAMADPANQTDLIIYIAGYLGTAISLFGALGQVGAQHYVQRLWAHEVASGTSLPLPAEALAEMVARQIEDPVVAAAAAATTGYSQDNFDRMVVAASPPPSPSDMLSLYLRGVIDQATLTGLLTFAGYRDADIQLIIAAAQSTMSQAEVIQAAIKNVITDSEAQALFAAAGGLPDQYATVFAAAGEPIGVQQANVLYLHGLISQADREAVILYSKINPRFEKIAELTAYHWLAPYQIAQALKAGAATAAEATTWMTQDGYPADQVAAFVGGYSSPAVAKAKQLTEAQIVDLYLAGEIDQGELGSLLEALGYPAADIAPIVETHDATKILAAQAQAVALVRKAFLAYRITAGTASGQLDALGVQSVARDAYLADWAAEQATQFRALTETQIVDAAVAGLITIDDATGRLGQLGYTVADANLLLGLKGVGPLAPPLPPATGA